MTSRYLGIDAGGVSGFAILNPNGDILAWGNLLPEDIESSVLKAFANDPETSVCIEYPATIRTSKKQAAMHSAVDALKRMFPTAATVTPGVWKTSAVAPQPVPKKVGSMRVSQHMQDAVGIARWHRLQVLKQQEKEHV